LGRGEKRVGFVEVWYKGRRLREEGGRGEEKGVLLVLEK
jgi:hypothetical protein